MLILNVLVRMFSRVSGNLYVFIICIGLILAAVVAFEPMRHNQFVDFDDDDYVTDNPRVRSGLTLESVSWAFTSSHSFNWHPLTWLSHMLDCELFDLHPFWHHLTSFLLHTANTLLLFWVFKKMTGAVWPSVFVAAAFALHPVHVESVAWVAERKDVLSGFFWMLTIAAYIHYVKRPSLARYILVVLLFCMGLMSKPMVITLPFVLLLLDYWPLGRLNWKNKNSKESLGQSKSAKLKEKKVSLPRLIGEKIPLFIFAVISGVITIIAQRSGQATAPMEDIPFGFRIANALVSYIGYIGKMIYPRYLALFYPISSEGLPIWQPIVCSIILIGVSVAVVYSARRHRYLLVGWLWYLGTLVPVIGLVQVGGQAMADRYTYLPSIGIFIMIAWGAAESFAKWRYKKIVLGITSIVILAVLLICTRLQVGHWRNSSSLFEHTLAVTENNYVIHNNYGLVLRKKGLSDEAFMHFREALRINPRSSIARINMGVMLLRQGGYDQAIDHFNQALRFAPVRPQAYYCLGMAYHQKGNYELAVQNYKQSLQLAPNNPAVIRNLAMALERQGKIDEAIGQWKRLLQLEPNSSDSYFSLGLSLAQNRKYDEAIKCFVNALRIKPDQPEIYYYMALANERRGKYDLAIQNYKDALRLRKDWVGAMNNLAWILATAGDDKFRNPAEALELARRACELSSNTQADILDTLAAAYAAEGSFDKATETAVKALKIAEDSGQKELAEQIRKHLQLYQDGKPYRHLSPAQNESVP